jgi:hypothetical protein
VRDAVKRFVVSRDRKAECDESRRQPLKKKIESVGKSNDLFKEYQINAIGYEMMAPRLAVRVGQT